MTTPSSRREFLKRSSAFSVAGAAAPWALNLAAISEAAAQSAPDDYKALVCIFLYGGNDHGNTLVPYDQGTYDIYASLRSTLATPRDAALAANELVPATGFELPLGRKYALAPKLSMLKPVFDAGRLGVLLNIGPLTQITSKAEYSARSVPLPPRLFSHNDQQSTWQASSPEGSVSGWGGRIGDLLASGNGQSVFTAVSVTGNAVYLSGRSAVQYQVTSNGSVPISGIGNTLYGSTAAAQALRSLITSTPGTNLFEREHARVVQRSIDADVALRSALAGITVTPFPATGLGSQLSMVARMIAARSAVGAKRQVFFVGIGGFDAHDKLADNHPALLTQIGDAMAAFDAAMVQQGTSSQVTAFTASDFGRTLSSNGDGSDHGWGSFHFISGGAVRGQRFFGTAPLPGNNGPDDVGQGRMLPTMAVDQLAATLATWMGVTSPTDLATVVPGIGNYNVKNLGLFA
jgi:uncharacterized protein (DUF1501 family)